MTDERIVPYEEKIAVGLPRGGDTKFHYEFFKSMFEMFGRSPCNYKLLTASKAHHLARNEIFKKFLQTDMNYLLTIDSDMIWESDSIELAYKLIQHPQVDIVTGIYFTKGKPHLPVIKKLDLQSGCYNIFMNWGNEPFEVDGAGMGFMFISREVVKKIPQPICEWKGGFAEDLIFCLKAKKDHGFKIWAHPHIKLGHTCKTTITSHDWITQHKPSMEAWVRESMRGTTAVLKKQYPNWRKELGIHPMDFKNMNTGKYWDGLYIREGLRDTWRTYPEKHEYIVKDLLKGMKGKVLELGCGVGIFASKLAESHECEYLGMDISDVAIKALNEAGFKGIVRSVPPIGIDEQFDVVIGLEFLEHLDEKPRLQIIKEASKIIGNKGMAIFSVPDNCMPPEDVIEHRVVYNKKTYENFLKKAFKKVEVISFVTRPSHIFSGKEQFLIGICSNKKGKNEIQSK